MEAYVNAVRLGSGGSPVTDDDTAQDCETFVERASHLYHDSRRDPLPVKFNYDRWLAHGSSF